jgi:hypothetical protein
MTFGILKEFPRIYNWKRNQKWIKIAGTVLGQLLAQGFARLAQPDSTSRLGWPGKGGVVWRALEPVTTPWPRA